MTKSIKINEMKAMDETEVEILRVLALHIGDRARAFVDFKIISASLNIPRRRVSAAVKRMQKKKILDVVHGEIEILNEVRI